LGLQPFTQILQLLAEGGLILFEKGQHLLYQGDPVSQVVEQIGKVLENTLVSKNQ